MRSESAFEIAPGLAAPDRDLSSRTSGLICALIFPLPLALLLGWLAETFVANEIVTKPGTSLSEVLIPLILGGMVLVSAVIALDCWADEKLGAFISDFRTALAISTSVALTFLAVWVTAQAERNQVSDAAEFVLFLCLPVLLVCSPLLWFSARAIRGTPRRLLLLTVFLAACALVELHCLNRDYRNSEEQLFMLHSLLIAVALTLRLGTWWQGGGARLSNRTGS